MTKPKRERPAKVIVKTGSKQPRSMSGGRGPSPLVGVRLPPEVHAKLKAFAEDRGHPTLPAAAREILEIWLVDFEPGK